MITKLVGIFAFSFVLSAGAKTIKFNFASEDIAKLIELYSKATGQKFISDPGVRGRITILNSKEITTDEAFNQISAALAIHGYAIVKIGDNMVVRPARAAQRSLLETTTKLPSLEPERLVTWIITLQNVPAEDVMRQFRNITTKDGDINVFSKTNQIIITDYTSNLHRVSEMLTQIDRPVEQKLSKLIEQNIKISEEAHKDWMLRTQSETRKNKSSQD